MSVPTEAGATNPMRSGGPTPHLSAGKHLIPQRYIVGWPDGVIKIGSTWVGRRRWGTFINRGARMLDLAYYSELGDSLEAEVWLHNQVAAHYPLAFSSKVEAQDRLRGGGWLECYRVPVSEWSTIVEMAGGRA